MPPASPSLNPLLAKISPLLALCCICKTLSEQKILGLCFKS